MSSKYLYCNSKDATNHADFRVIFPEPVVLPRNAQVRVVNARINLGALAPTEGGVFYLDCPDLPTKNYTGQKTFGKRNNYLGIIPLWETTENNLYSGEHQTHNYVDLHNSFPLTLTTLTLRVVDEDGKLVSDTVGTLGSCSNIVLHIRQDPVQRQAERLAELLRPMMSGARNDNEIAQPTVEINKKGQ